MARKRLGLLLVAMTACRSTGSTPSDAAGGAGGQGGAGGIDAGGGTGGTSGSGGGGSGGGGTDVGPPDAPADTGAPDMGGPDISVTPACGAGSTCQILRAQYADAVLRGQSCTVGTANACAHGVPGDLGCGIHSCAVWVNDDGPLAPLRAQFAAAGCDNCFYPGGDHCHAIFCPSLFTGSCRAGDGGQATCVINNPPAECPVGTAEGQVCPIPYWYCAMQGQPRQTCLCLTDPIPPGQPDGPAAPTWHCL